jgi:hypothetical protein
MEKIIAQAEARASVVTALRETWAGNLTWEYVDIKKRPMAALTG